MDFDNRKVYGDTSITDGLVSLIELTNLADELVKSLRKELSPPLADPSSAGLHLGESADLDGPLNHIFDQS